MAVINRQHVRRIDTRLLREIMAVLLEEVPGERPFDFNVSIVSSDAITRLNEKFLGHTGATDVITFDYSQGQSNRSAGEVVICLEQAVLQARRFRTTWQSELVRYMIHGMLHLCGYDDRYPGQRRQMKLVEGRLLRRISGRFNLAKLERR